MPTTATTIPPSANEAWGYHGTISHCADPVEAWNLALPAITAATGCAPDEVRHATIASRSLNADRRFAASLTAGTAATSPTR